MIDLQLLDRLKIIVLQIIEPFLSNFELNIDKSQLLIDSVHKLYDMQLSNMNRSDVEKLKNFISQESFINSYVHIFRSSFHKIFEDKKVNNNDIIYIIELVKNIVIEVNKSNKENSNTISIDVSTVIVLVKFLISAVIFIIYREDNIINIINSIFTLVEISILPISSNSCKWKCF